MKKDITDSIITTIRIADGSPVSLNKGGHYRNMRAYMIEALEHGRFDVIKQLYIYDEAGRNYKFLVDSIYAPQGSLFRPRTIRLKDDDDFNKFSKMTPWLPCNSLLDFAVYNKFDKWVDELLKQKIHISGKSLVLAVAYGTRELIDKIFKHNQDPAPIMIGAIIGDRLDLYEHYCGKRIEDSYTVESKSSEKELDEMLTSDASTQPPFDIAVLIKIALMYDRDKLFRRLRVDDLSKRLEFYLKLAVKHEAYKCLEYLFTINAKINHVPVCIPRHLLPHIEYEPYVTKFNIILDPSPIAQYHQILSKIKEGEDILTFPADTSNDEKAMRFIAYYVRQKGLPVKIAEKIIKDLVDISSVDAKLSLIDLFQYFIRAGQLMMVKKMVPTVKPLLLESKRLIVPNTTVEVIKVLMSNECDRFTLNGLTTTEPETLELLLEMEYFSNEEIGKLCDVLVEEDADTLLSEIVSYDSSFVIPIVAKIVRKALHPEVLEDFKRILTTEPEEAIYSSVIKRIGDCIHLICLSKSLDLIVSPIGKLTASKEEFEQYGLLRYGIAGMLYKHKWFKKWYK